MVMSEGPIPPIAAAGLGLAPRATPMCACGELPNCIMGASPNPVPQLDHVARQEKSIPPKFAACSEITYSSFPMPTLQGQPSVRWRSAVRESDSRVDFFPVELP